MIGIMIGTYTGRQGIPVVITVEGAALADAEDTTAQPTFLRTVAQVLRAVRSWAMRAFDYVNGGRPVSDIAYADFAMVGRAGEA
jgi:hypothetical protein